MGSGGDGLRSVFEEFARRVPFARAAGTRKKLVPATAPVANKPASEEDQRKERRNHLRQLLTKLEQQRQKLEEELVESHIRGDEQALAATRAKLADNELLRLNYRAELRALDESSDVTATRPNGLGKSVFLSSTFVDLKEHRLKVKDEIHKLRLEFSGMEWFGSDGAAAPAAKIVACVRACDIYVGVIGVRYGSIDDATGLSMTELEYQTAVTSGKLIYMYVLHDDATVTAALIERDAAAYSKLQAFKTRVAKNHAVFFFRSAEELARQVAADLRVYA